MSTSNAREFRESESDVVVMKWSPALSKPRQPLVADSADVAGGDLTEFDATAEALVAADGATNSGGGATPLSTSSKTRAFRPSDSAEIATDLPPPLAKPEQPLAAGFAGAIGSGLDELDATAGALVAADRAVNGGGGATPLSTSSNTSEFRASESDVIVTDRPPLLAKPKWPPAVGSTDGAEGGLDELDATAGALVTADTAVNGGGGAPLSTSSNTREFRASESGVIIIVWPPPLAELGYASAVGFADAAENGLNEFDGAVGALVAADGAVNGGGGAMPSLKTREFRASKSGVIVID